MSVLILNKLGTEGISDRIFFRIVVYVGYNYYRKKTDHPLNLKEEIHEDIKGLKDDFHLRKMSFFFCCLQ